MSSKREISTAWQHWDVVQPPPGVCVVAVPRHGDRAFYGLAAACDEVGGVTLWLAEDGSELALEELRGSIWMATPEAFKMRMMDLELAPALPWL
jgi:hypothetical protein